MLGKKKYEPKIMYNLTLDELVPEDNLYRQIDKFLNLRFVYKECEKLYGKTGKPSIDPVVFFKLELFGYFENIISDRELIRRANDSLAARYFIGYDLDEQLPWHSTISRTRALISKETFEKIFNRILELCYKSGLIEGKHQSIDSTLVKANASLDSLEIKQPKLTLEEYINKRYEENEIEEDQQKEDNGKEEREKKAELRIEKSSDKKANRKTTSNKDYQSKTDPDSRVAIKPGKPGGLYYSTHYSSDSKKRIITDVLTTYADRVDSLVLMEVYQRAENRLEKLGLRVQEVSADKGYCSGKSLREFERRGIKAFIPTKKYTNPGGKISYNEFIYNQEKNLFYCPNHKELSFYTFENDRQANRYRAKEDDCSQCPLKEDCCPKAKRRKVSRTIYYKEYDNLEQRLKTPEARRAYVIRKTVAEGLFAEGKMYHGLRKFMTRGIEKAQKRSYMIASVQNLKRLLGQINGTVKKAHLILNDLLGNLFLPPNFNLCVVNINKK